MREEGGRRGERNKEEEERGRRGKRRNIKWKEERGRG